MEAVAPEIQGHIFAANSLMTQTTHAIAVLIAGPADQVLEPAMMPGGSLANLLGFVFGRGPGAGMAVIYTSCALAMVFVGVSGLGMPRLRAIEGNVDSPSVNAHGHR
ncbi:MAG: hypothetical protein AAGH78_00405 [Cyanobacteria bacterium P01_H01_bin.58]